MPHREVQSRVESFFGPARFVGVVPAEVQESPGFVFVFEVTTPEGVSCIVRAHQADRTISMTRSAAPVPTSRMAPLRND